MDLEATALRHWLQFVPMDYKGWIELAFADVAQSKPDEALAAFKRAVDIGGEEAQKMFQWDSRIGPLKSNPEFQKLIAAPPLSQ